MTALGHGVVAAGLLAAAAAASAGGGSVYPGTPAVPVEIEQRIGAGLPLELAFVAEDGRRVALGDYFTPARAAGVPVVLVLGYYRCQRLCETVMEGALEALAASGAGRGSYRVVEVSIDPADTPADARARLRTDRAVADLATERFGRAPGAAGALDLHALVGARPAIDRLARAVGFGFARREGRGPQDDAVAAFDHAAGFVVATPQGRVSRYFLGVRHDPVLLRQALDEARVGGVGSFVDRLVLLCAHVDPTLGRWSQPVLVTLRLLGVALAAALALWIWRQRGARTAKASA